MDLNNNLLIQVNNNNDSVATSVVLKVRLQQAKAEAKANVFFDAYKFLFDFFAFASDFARCKWVLSLVHIGRMRKRKRKRFST